MKTIFATLILCLSAFSAIAQSPTSARGCVVFKRASQTAASVEEFRKFENFGTNIAVTDLTGNLLTVLPGERPIFIPYPSDSSATLEKATAQIGIARKTYPELSRRLAAVEKAWAAVPQAKAAAIATAPVSPPPPAASKPSLGATPKGMEIVTTNGTKYENVTVTLVEPDGISISHEAGVAKVLFTDLSEANRAKYGYDPEKAAQAQKASLTGRVFSEGRRPFDETLTDSEKFFETYIATGHPKPRDQFETQQEYEARLPKPSDAKRIYYFTVDHEPSFTYDINTERLTLFAGVFKSPDYQDYNLSGMVPFSFHQKYDDMGTHEASNAYGKTVTVKKAYYYEYFFHFAPKSFDPRLSASDKAKYVPTQRLALTFRIPRDQAKEAAAHLSLVCGVRLLDPKRSVRECTLSTKPTIDRPYELATFSSGIDAEVLSVHVVDTRTKEEIARFGPP